MVLVVVVPKERIRLRLQVKSRKDNKGRYIASVPYRQLLKMSKCNEKYRRWSLVGDWLILEAW